MKVRKAVIGGVIVLILLGAVVGVWFFYRYEAGTLELLYSSGIQTGSQIRKMSYAWEARAYREHKWGTSPFDKQYSPQPKITKGDAKDWDTFNMTNVNVSLTLHITIVNVTGRVLYNKTLTLEDTMDRSIEMQFKPGSITPCTNLNITITLHVTIDYNIPVGAHAGTYAFDRHWTWKRSVHIEEVRPEHGTTWSS